MTVQPRRNNNNNNDRDEPNGRRELAFILIVPILALSFLPITGSPAPYTDNFAKQAGGANQQTVTLPSTIGVLNCTGVTTVALTARGTKAIVISGAYSASSINVTNWYEWVLVNIGTTAPSINFGNGVCAVFTNGQRWIMSEYMPVTGLANWFTVGFTFTFTPVAGNTYYAWIDLEQRGGAAGTCASGCHVSYRNEGLSASSLTMREVP